MSAILTPLPSPHPEFPRQPSGGKSTWNVLPFPLPAATTAPVSSAAPLPPWPAAPMPEKSLFPTSWPSPLTVLPTLGTESTHPASQPEIQILPTSQPVNPGPPVAPATASAEPTHPDFTDDDLREAFGPIVEQAVRKAVYAQENGIDTYLEPMLRATIRRALAEYSPAGRPFQPPGAMDRFIWHVQALFTSRTYEDIYFEKTRRFHVEEVFLLDVATLALVSFASCNPARHSSARRVSDTVHRLALHLRDDDGKIRPVFKLPDGRSVISRQGRYVILMALIRGIPGELACTDLEFALRRIEDHFRDQFEQHGSALLYALQPFLEDCLLIQSPANAA